MFTLTELQLILLAVTNAKVDNLRIDGKPAPDWEALQDIVANLIDRRGKDLFTWAREQKQKR